jgi:hypothetical protein
MEILATLCENESLETLEMIREYTGLEDYLKCAGAIQSNTTLKKLQLHEDIYVDLDEFKDLIPFRKKNYGLEEISGLCNDDTDFRSIFDLNRAGRRYLVQDGSSISKGLDVLSREAVISTLCSCICWRIYDCLTEAPSKSLDERFDLGCQEELRPTAWNVLITTKRTGRKAAVLSLHMTRQENLIPY